MTFVTPVSKTFHFENVTVQVVYGVFNQIDLKKSSGLDGINIQLFKDASHINAKPLVNVFNLFLKVCMVKKYILNFVATPRNFIIAKLSIRNPGSSSVLIIYDLF